MRRNGQATPSTRSVVSVTSRSQQPNQELRLSFIDVNAKPKVKLEAVKRGYEQRQSREISCRCHSPKPSGMRRSGQATTSTRSVVFLTSRSQQPNQELRLSLKLEVVKRGYKQRRCRVISCRCHSSKPSGMRRSGQATPSTRSVVFVTSRSQQPNQELRLSFIDVNAKPKVKLEAVKRGYKQRQSREISRRWREFNSNCSGKHNECTLLPWS